MSRGMLVSIVVAALASACGGGLDLIKRHPAEEAPGQSMHRDDLPLAAAEVCGAARNVLLGDGYVVYRAAPDDELALVGTREFLVEKDQPAVLQLHVSCRQAKAGTALFATAVESRFVVSQTRQKTSVGIPIVAPVAVSSTTTSEAMLKVSGETLRDPALYKRFFSAVKRELGIAPPPAQESREVSDGGTAGAVPAGAAAE